MARKKPLYEALDVPDTASKEEIRKAHRKRVRKVHPDAGGDTESFALVQRAYETLMDDGRRKRYDETGDDSEPRPNEANAVHSLLASVMLGAIQQITQTGGKIKNKDIVKAMREMLGKALATHKANRANFVESVKVIDDVIDRLKDPKNLLRSVMESERIKIQAGISGADGAIADHDAALAYLKECRFRFDEPIVGGVNMSTMTATAGGLWSFNTG